MRPTSDLFNANPFSTFEAVIYGQTDKRGQVKRESTKHGRTPVSCKSQWQQSERVVCVCVCVCVYVCSVNSGQPWQNSHPVDALCLLQPIAKRLERSERSAPPVTNKLQPFTSQWRQHRWVHVLQTLWVVFCSTSTTAPHTTCRSINLIKNAPLLQYVNISRPYLPNKVGVNKKRRK